MKAALPLTAVWCAATLLASCASIYADRFYTLRPLPDIAPTTRQQFSAEMSIRVTLPATVDRSQMVLENGNGVSLMEHERWASPLVEQFAAVLGQDVELRRPDIVITSRPLSQGSGIQRLALQVDVSELVMRKAGPLAMTARWRIDAVGGATSTGREVFSAQPANATPAALAAALSECVSRLAEQVARQLGNAGQTSQPR